MLNYSSQYALCSSTMFNISCHNYLIVINIANHSRTSSTNTLTILFANKSLLNFI